MADVNRLSLPTFGLGKIQNYDDEKSAGMSPVSFPGEDSDQTIGIDTLGVIAYANITGRLTDTFNELQDTIAKIKSIIDGKQTSWQPFYSPFLVYTYETGGTKYRRQGGMGTNTTATASKLIDTNALFSTRGVRGPHTAQGVLLEGDVVKNLITGAITRVVTVDSNTQLTLLADIFPNTGTPYAVSVHMACKLLSFKARWSLPGLNYVDYDLSIMQVEEA